MDGSSGNSRNDGGVVNDVREFAQGFLYSAVQAPADAVAQIVGAKPLAAPITEDPGLFSKAGSIAGSVADYVVLSKVLKFAGRPLESTLIARTLPILEPALAGGILEASRPADLNGNGVWAAKGKQFLIGGATFGVMGGVQNNFNQSSFFGRAGQRSIVDSIVANSVAAGAGGATGSYLDAGLNKHRAPTVSELSRAVFSNAAFGAMFGAADVALDVTKPNIKLSSDIKAGEAPADTAQWVKDGYDPNVPIRSPIFDYIARTNPELRPANYDAWKSQQQSGSAEKLSLSDFSSEQRSKLVGKLRQLAQSDLATDANIDAFIRRLTRSNLNILGDQASLGLTPVAEASMKQWKTASMLLNVMRENIAPGRSMAELINDEPFLQVHPQFNAQLRRTLDAETAYTALRPGDASAVLVPEFQKTLAAIAREAHLPEPRVVLTDDGGGGYLDNKIEMSKHELNPAVSTGTVETSLHEFRHHQEGFWTLDNLKALIHSKFRAKFRNDDYSTKPLGRYERANDQIDELERLSLTMHIPGAGLNLARQIADNPGRFNELFAQDPGTRPSSYRSLVETPTDITDGALRTQFKQLIESRVGQLKALARKNFGDYVTDPSELRAYSTGILGRMRAQAWGLPEPVAGDIYKSKPESLVQYKKLD